MKRAIQLTIRGAHKVLSSRDAPEKVALYFHELEAAQYPAFTECMAYWMDQGYRCVDAAAFLSSENEKVLFVSFDDNFKSWHDALPLLDSLDVRATFFVNTLPIRGEADPEQIEQFFDRIHHTGERVPLSRDEIRELATSGHTIGCHSHSHFDLGSIDRSSAESEILTAKQILEEILQEPVPDFSYPFGMRRNFTDELRDFCMANGFRTVCNAIPGRLHERPQARFLNRSPWDLGQSLDYNLTNIKIDGRLFESVTGRSAAV